MRVDGAKRSFDWRRAAGSASEVAEDRLHVHGDHHALGVGARLAVAGGIPLLGARDGGWVLEDARRSLQREPVAAVDLAEHRGTAGPDVARLAAAAARD